MVLPSERAYSKSVAVTSVIPRTYRVRVGVRIGVRVRVRVRVRVSVRVRVKDP